MIATVLVSVVIARLMSICIGDASQVMQILAGIANGVCTIFVTFIIAANIAISKAPSTKFVREIGGIILLYTLALWIFPVGMGLSNNYSLQEKHGLLLLILSASLGLLLPIMTFSWQLSKESRRLQVN